MSEQYSNPHRITGVFSGGLGERHSSFPVLKVNSNLLN